MNLKFAEYDTKFDRVFQNISNLQDAANKPANLDPNYQKLNLKLKELKARIPLNQN